MLLALLAAGELAARAVLPSKGSPGYERYLIESWGPFFRADTEGGRQVLVQVPHHPWFPAPQRIAMAKPPGQERLIVLGESSAWMLGNALSQVIAREGLDKALGCVNMGIGGSSWEQTRRHFDEALGYGPDVMLILFGHNLFYFHPLPRPDTPGLHSLLALCRASRLLSGLRLSGRTQAGDSFTVPSRWRVFRSGLLRMADEAAQRGVRLALCTVPSNLRFPPDGPEAVRWDPEFLRARYLQLRGQSRPAADICRALIARKAEAYWSFHLGEWLYAAGDYAGARRYLESARDMDPARHRATGAINNIIRNVARARGLLLLDMERLIADSAPHGIPGWESFKDNQHVLDVNFEAEAQASLGALGRRSVRVQDAPVVDENLTGAETAIRRGETADPARLLSYLSEDLWQTGQRTRALALNDAARKLAPRDEELDVQRARFCIGSGDAAQAQQWLREALRLRPDQGEARFYLRMLEGPQTSNPRSG